MNFKLDSKDVWSMYWSTGEQHSCVAAQSQDDLAAINQYWFDAVVQLPINARVLDLACGNGAVSLTLAAKRADLVIDAVDKSELAPNLKSVKANDNIRFYESTDILALPEHLKGYDLICSQFGVEYAGLKKLVPVLKDRIRETGSLRFLIHHHSSDLVSGSRLKLQEYQALESINLFVLVNDVVSTMIDEGQAHRSARQKLEYAGQAFVEKQIGTKPIAGKIFDAIAEILALPREQNARARALADNISIRAYAEQQRLGQMIDSAQTPEMMDEFVNLLDSAGFEHIDLSQFALGDKSEPYLLAWSLQAS